MKELNPAAQLKRLRRFSIFMGIQNIGWGFFAVMSGIIFSHDPNGGITFFSIVCALIAGFLWQSAYLSFNSAKEMKAFNSIEEYLDYVKEDLTKKK